MNEQYPNASTPPPPPPPPSTGSGAAVASLVLGLLAMVLSLVLVGALLGLVGIILGLMHLKRQTSGGRGMAKWGIALSLVAILASAGLGVAYYTGYKKVRAIMADATSGTQSVQEWEGALAPDITVTSLDGETIKLSDLKGKRVVLDFWATWCPPCVKEIPHFIELTKETSRDDLIIVGISQEDVEQLKPFVKKHNINYPIASASDLPAPYSNVTAIPTTFFIDRKGVIQSILTGYHDLSTLRASATAADREGEPKPAPGTNSVPPSTESPSQAL